MRSLAMPIAALSLVAAGACSAPPDAWTDVRETGLVLPDVLRATSFADEREEKLYRVLVEIVRESGGSFEFHLENIENSHKALAPDYRRLVGWTERMSRERTPGAKNDFAVDLELWNGAHGVEEIAAPGVRSAGGAPHDDDVACRIGYARMAALHLLGQRILMVATEVTTLSLPGPESTRVCFGSTSRMTGALGEICADLEIVDRPGVVNLTPPGEDRLVYDPDYSYGFMPRARVLLRLC